MKILIFFLFVTMLVISNTYFSISLVNAQCYGCGSNSTALKNALQERQQEEQTKNMNNIILSMEIGIPIIVSVGVFIFLFSKRQKQKFQT